jgi:hypothetical protein
MPKLWVCRACAKGIGSFASRSRESRVWSTQSRPPEVEKVHASAGDVDVELVFEEFKAGVATQVAPDDFGTHLDLAEAYREMGLCEDALREAAGVLVVTALQVAPLATKMTECALRLLLTPPLLKPRGLHFLRQLLHTAN